MVKTPGWLAVGVVSLPLLLSAQAKKHKLPALFDHARYVWVEAADGDEFKPGLLPEDRQAIADVEDSIRDWNRYILTARREEADLVFVVRKGRVASATLGGTVGSGGPIAGPQRTPALGAKVGTEVGPPDDLLQVCERHTDGTLSGPIWMKSQAGGLDGPDPELFQRLRKAVDEDYPLKPATQNPKKP